MTAAFALSPLSHGRLYGVRADLVRVIKRAITITTVDFGVQEGVRSIAAEVINIAHGVSHLKDPAHCRHCIQADGFGHAADLVPYIGGQPKWLWPAIYPVADAMRLAAAAEGVSLRWGGCWADMDGLPAGPEGLEAARDDYAAKHPKGLLDGVHFELVI